VEDSRLFFSFPMNVTSDRQLINNIFLCSINWYGRSPVLPFPIIMHRKRKSTDESSNHESKKLYVKPCAAAVVVVPVSSVRARAIQADSLVKQATFMRLQASECIKLARVLYDADTRPLNERVADIIQLVQQDSEREVPLLTLSFQLEVIGLLMSL
jgi:hypothetical protein